MRNSMIGSLRYDDIRPRTTPQTESTEKLSVAPGNEDAAQDPDDGIVYPTGMKLGLITLALCLAVFVMALGREITPLKAHVG